MSTHSNTANKTLIDKDAVEKIFLLVIGKNSVNKWLFLLCTLIGLIVLVALLIQTFVKGAGHLTPEFSLIFHLQHQQMLVLKSFSRFYLVNLKYYSN